MHSASRVVVLMLTLGVMAVSYCAQVCAMPQATASACPEHHPSDQSENTNCCKHAATDATTNEKSISSPQLKSALLRLAPVPLVNTVCLMEYEIPLHEKFKPLDSFSQFSTTPSVSILRI